MPLNFVDTAEMCMLLMLICCCFGEGKGHISGRKGVFQEGKDIFQESGRNIQFKATSQWSHLLCLYDMQNDIGFHESRCLRLMMCGILEMILHWSD